MEQNRVLAQTLGAVGSIINQVTDLDLVLKITMDHALRALGAERGYILLRGEDGTLSVRMTRNMGDIRGFSQSIAESVIENGKAILTTDAQVDPRFSKAQSVMINAIRAVMCVPLRGRSVQAVGAIFVDGVPGNPMFSDRGMQFLNSFAGQAATAIENAALAQKSALEQRRRERLSRYFSGPVIDGILASGSTDDHERLGGESRVVTLAFTDIRGFTTLLEKIKPQEAVEMLNDYFTEIVDEVIAEQGTLDKFMGDGLMAFWNAPHDQADHALRSVKAALKMQERVKVLLARWKQEKRSFVGDIPELSTGIGINTGEAIVGNIGSPKRMEYTAIGDSVNLAARLQGVAKGGEILVSDSTLALVKDAVRYTTLEPVSIKGKGSPVPLFRIDGLV
jgi:adenylate cyclase